MLSFHLNDPPRTELIGFGEVSLRIRTAGSGPLLVLLPGMGRPARDLDPLAACLVVAGRAAGDRARPGRRGSDAAADAVIAALRRVSA
jgi:hypothetical protein